MSDNSPAPWQIAVASGKGGTGKTTVATNLAVVAADQGASVALLDCDVEAANCHLFLQAAPDKTETVCLDRPAVDTERCTGCGLCSEVCEFNAIACMNGQVVIFPELCHACGGCWRFCPEDAITPTPDEIGLVKTARSNGIVVRDGQLKVGQALSPPLIERVRDIDPGHVDLIIIDAPPGTSCAAVAAVQDADFVCLVTEPTPFGLNDLVLAVEMCRKLGREIGVVVNRMGIGDGRVHDYCAAEGIEVLAEIPDDRRIAETYSRGELLCRALPDARERFERLLATLRERQFV